MLLLLALLPQGSQPAHRPLSGEVVDATGKPVAGATVRLWSCEETLPWDLQRVVPGKARELGTAQSGDDGRFRFDVEDGRFFTVMAQRGALELAPAEVFVPSGARVVLRLLAPITVTGLVQRKVDGQLQAVAGVKVTLRVGSGSVRDFPGIRTPELPSLQVDADAAGSFRAEVPGTGSVWASASVAIAGQKWSGGATARAAAPVTIELQQQQAGEPPKPLTLKFVDKASGKPVAGVRVVEWGRESDGKALESDADGVIKTTTTNSNGMVLPREHARTMVTSGGDTPAEMRIELDKGLGCKARLLGSDGKPLANAQVVFGGPVQRETTTWHNMPWSARTDAEGRIDLRCLQSGMTLFGYAEVDGVFAPFVHATPANDLDLGDVRLATTGRITGRVLGPDGPVANARILIQTAGSGKEFEQMSLPSRRARSNTMGLFVVGRMVAGKYRVAAVAPDCVPGFADVVVGDKTQPLEFQLVRGARVAGRVLLPDGKPAAKASVYCWLPNTSQDQTRFAIQATTESDADGRFVVGGLPEGVVCSLNLHLGDGNGQWLHGQAQNIQTGTTDVEVTLSGR